MLDGCVCALEVEELHKKQMLVIESLAKERDEFQDQLNEQIHKTNKIQELLDLEVQSKELQEDKFKKIVMHLMEERKMLLLELHKLQSRVDKTENNFLTSQQATSELRSEIADLNATSYSLKDKNHRLTMETQDLREQLKEQSRNLATLAQKTAHMTTTPRHVRNVPKTNPNIRTNPRPQSLYIFQTPPEEPQPEIARRFITNQKKETRRSVPNLHFPQIAEEDEKLPEKPKRGLLKRLSMRLGSPNVGKNLINLI